MKKVYKALLISLCSLLLSSALLGHHIQKENDAQKMVTFGYSLSRFIFAHQALPEPGDATLLHGGDGPPPASILAEGANIQRSFTLLAEYAYTPVLTFRIGDYYTLHAGIGDPLFGLEYEIPLEKDMDFTIISTASWALTRNDTGHTRNYTALTVTGGLDRTWKYFEFFMLLSYGRTLVKEHKENSSHFAFVSNGLSFAIETDFEIYNCKMFVNYTWLINTPITSGASVEIGTAGISYILNL